MGARFEHGQGEQPVAGAVRAESLLRLAGGAHRRRGPPPPQDLGLGKRDLRQDALLEAGIRHLFECGPRGCQLLFGRDQVAEPRQRPGLEVSGDGGIAGVIEALGVVRRLACQGQCDHRHVAVEAAGRRTHEAKLFQAGIANRADGQDTRVVLPGLGQSPRARNASAAARRAEAAPLPSPMLSRIAVARS